MKGKMVLGLVIVFGLILIARTGAGVYRLWKAGERVDDANKQLALAQEKNRQLTLQLQEVQTPEYMERLAREKLGYGRPGEVVVVIPKEQVESGKLKVESESVPNWKQWRKLYLGF